jgi:hypothetical protein
MKSMKITPLTVQQYSEISNDIYDEIERIVCVDMLAAKCVKHPEYGDIILVSSRHGGCLMIHEPTLVTPPRAGNIVTII